MISGRLQTRSLSRADCLTAPFNSSVIVCSPIAPNASLPTIGETIADCSNALPVSEGGLGAGGALQIAARHVEPAGVAEHDVEGMSRRNVERRTAERDDKLHLVVKNSWSPARRGWRPARRQSRSRAS